MDETPLLKLPYILAAQSQKHVTHNEALRALDAVVQISVLDKDLATPPGSPANGDRYIVAAAPTGVWSGHAICIAAYQDGAWAIYVPREGWLAWVADENVLYAFDGASWIPAPGAGGSVNPVAMVGVNATADATNRLSVASAATLLNHDGAGHQLKINKASAGQNGSVLFQTGYSGRAEFGLTGSDDFEVKVSADGSTWKQAIVTNRSTGVVQFPFTPGREVLTANRSYYVRIDGNDANTGLVNSSGGAFLTIQKALDVAAALDSSIYNITINVGAGTFATAQTLKACVGSGTISIVGAGVTTIIDPAGSTSCFQALSGGQFALSNLKVQKTSGSGHGVYAQNCASVVLSGVDFGSFAAGRHLFTTFGASVTITANYTISGGAQIHASVISGGIVQINSGVTVTLTGTPAFSSMFAYSAICGVVRCEGLTFSGSATGTRYFVDRNAVIHVASAGATYLPGNAAGSATNGGLYA